MLNNSESKKILTLLHKLNRYLLDPRVTPNDKIMYSSEVSDKIEDIIGNPDKLPYEVSKKSLGKSLDYTDGSDGMRIKNPNLTFIPKFDYSDEEWKIITYKGDEISVSSYGRVARNSRILKQSSSSGRFKVAVGEKRSAVLVHKLVALTFIGERPEGYDIDHVNGNRLDNRAINLEYVTHEENINRAIKLGLIKR